jgi:hypothetical protein
LFLVSNDNNRIQQQEQQSEKDLMDIIASTIGGIIFGLIFGSFLTFQSSIAELASNFFGDTDNSVPQQFLIIPTLTGILLGIVGLVGSLQDNSVGIVVRSLFAFPVLTLVSATLDGIESFIESVQAAAREQVENTTNNIKALPGKIADSAQQTAARAVESAVEEVTSIPRKAKQKVVESSIQAVDNVKSSVNSAVQDVASLPRKAKDTVLDSLSKEFLLALFLISSCIGISVFLLDNVLVSYGNSSL